MIDTNGDGVLDTFQQGQNNDQNLEISISKEDLTFFVQKINNDVNPSFFENNSLQPTQTQTK